MDLGKNFKGNQMAKKNAGVLTNNKKLASKGVVKKSGQDEVKRFRAAAKKFSQEATSSQAAKKILIELGISTPTGRLTKRYK